MACEGVAHLERLFGIFADTRCRYVGLALAITGTLAIGKELRVSCVANILTKIQVQVLS